MGEELQEVRVTCNEQNVLETVVKGTQSHCVSSNTGKDLFLLHHILLAALDVLLCHKSTATKDYK